MALSPTDQPQDLPCGVWSQDEVDSINSWRNVSFAELIALRSEIGSISQALNALISGLPSQICNAVSPRFHSQSVVGNALRITLPAGGAYRGIFILNSAEEGVPFAFASWASGEGNTDDDRQFVGSTSGVYAGGFTMSIPAGSQGNRGSLTFFGYKIDC